MLVRPSKSDSFEVLTYDVILRKKEKEKQEVLQFVKFHKLNQQLLIVNISRLSRDLSWIICVHVQARASCASRKYSKLLRTNRIEN